MGKEDSQCARDSPAVPVPSNAGEFGFRIMCYYFFFDPAPAAQLMLSLLSVSVFGPLSHWNWAGVLHTTRGRAPGLSHPISLALPLPLSEAGDPRFHLIFVRFSPSPTRLQKMERPHA